MEVSLKAQKGVVRCSPEHNEWSGHDFIPPQGVAGDLAYGLACTRLTMLWILNAFLLTTYMKMCCDKAMPIEGLLALE